MPVTKQQRQATPISVVEDVVGDGLVTIYVTTRHPLSGNHLDGPALVVIVDEHRTDPRSYVSELTAEIPQRTGAYHEVFVYSEEERDNLTLRDGDIVEM